MAYQTSSRSPPPLLHPVPTHPTFIPEPPSTPASPQGYQRFASSSSPPPHQQQQPQPQSYYAQNLNMSTSGGRAPYASHFSPQQQPQLHASQGYQPGHIGGPQVPDFSAWGLDGATTQLGMQLGQSAVQAGQDYVQQNVRFHLRPVWNPPSLLTLRSRVLAARWFNPAFASQTSLQRL
jgi:protein transport protein YIF1